MTLLRPTAKVPREMWLRALGRFPIAAFCASSTMKIGHFLEGGGWRQTAEPISILPPEKIHLTMFVDTPCRMVAPPLKNSFIYVAPRVRAISA